MKKTISAYWACQILGWGAFIIAGVILYSRNSGVANFPSYFSIVTTGILGLFCTHLMRLFITRSSVLNGSVVIQFIFMFLHALLFSFIYLIFQWFFEFLRSPAGFESEFDMRSIAGGIMTNFNFLIIWIFIYFSYHYIQKSRRHLIETIRLEGELKIQQLQNENTQLNFEKGLAEVSLNALRAQMNPHFIFNCLNSIKLYTAQNDKEAASTYVSKFSKLIRLVMENSLKEKILLSSELELLRLYIDMEAMRFKEKLQYTITIEKNVEPEYIEFPPLLIQPYVENAIWHGLMPKDEGGRIDISIGMNNDKSILEIIIMDNGIGRKMAGSIKHKTAPDRKPSGMRITSERITLLNQVYKTGAKIQVDDLEDESQNPLGTKVTILLPV